MKQINTNKKAQSGLIGGLVAGIGGLVILIIVIFVIVSTLSTSNLLTTGSSEDNATLDLRANLTEGVNNVSEKVPTVLKVAAVVLLLGVLVFLYQRARPIIGSNAGSL